MTKYRITLNLFILQVLSPLIADSFHLGSNRGIRQDPVHVIDQSTIAKPILGIRRLPYFPNLCLASSRRGTTQHSNKKSNQKKLNPPTKSRTKNGSSSSDDFRKTGTSRASTSAPSYTSKQERNNKHQAPPWQTISSKDMAKNIETEKERRKLAQEQGRQVSKVQLEATQSQYDRSTSFLSIQDKSLLAWKPFTLNHNHEVLFQGAYLNKQLPPRLGVPEVAFLGRSNVGKSSLLNRLVGKSNLARVGKTPGATASVNLYGIFGEEKGTKATKSSGKGLLGLVDLPGFGYAKLDKKTKESVQETAENYLEQRKELALGVLLVDIRRTPTVDDKAVLAALFDMGVPLVVVATKVDKLSSQRQVEDALSIINHQLGLPEGQPLCISSVTGQGIKDLWKIILEACEGRVAELRLEANKGCMGEEDKEIVLGDVLNDIIDPNDDSEIFYDQGYDWIQGSVLYSEEGDDGPAVSYHDESHEYDRNFSGDEYDSNRDEHLEFLPSQKQSIKFWRKKADDLRKRGDL